MMTRRTYWGVAALIILVIAAGGFIYYQWSEVQQLKEEVAQDKKWLEEENKPVAETPIDYTKPPPGKTFANGGHWHNGEWHDEPHAPVAVETAHKSLTTYKNNGEYVDIDYSVFDKPEELIARIGEIKLNREKYSQYEYDKASQEAMIFSRKLLDGYYGKDEYFEKLWELKNKTYGDALLKRGFGISREELRAMIRGEIPLLVVPIDPAVLDKVDGGNK
jgi:hypothetical protein